LNELLPKLFDETKSAKKLLCHNDPVNRIDPTGLQDFKPVTVFSRDGEYEVGRFTTTVSRPELGSNLRPEIHWGV